MDQDVWWLAGPRAFAREVVEEVVGGRHAAVVLPRHLAREQEFVQPLAHLLMTELSPRVDEVRRVLPDPDSDSLLDTVARAMTWDDTPATVPELLAHPDAAGCAAVLVPTDLEPTHRGELDALLTRLGSDARRMAPARRPRLVTITTVDLIPSVTTGRGPAVSVAALWWWNRVARWDMAAFVAHRLGEPAAGDRVVHDVQAETIVEVARWDLALAADLCRSWSGDPIDLTGLIGPPTIDGTEGTYAGPCGRRPANAVVQAWDDGRIDGWHDRHAPKTTGSPTQLDRAVWAAQARILLPWVEERRLLLHQKVLATLGPAALERAVIDLFPVRPDPHASLEIGLLRKVVDRRLARTEPTLLTAANKLTRARNALAHLDPLSLAEITELVAACAVLDRTDRRIEPTPR